MTIVAPLNFTAEQRALIDATEATYVEACPGAGKTQAIVQRFIERPVANHPRRGVALLSFTNAAVDEARARCAAVPELLEVPNFVGTIDAFINRFIVGPVHVARTGRAPSFRDTWASVPGTRISVKGVAGAYALDWFEFTLDGDAELVYQRIPPDRRTGARSLRRDQLDKIVSAASARWNALVERGILDATTSRQLMAEYLKDEGTKNRLHGFLDARFAEVIVDEVQDCTEEDVLLLEMIKEAGPRLICVGDPDQAIYGFRGSGTESLGRLLDRLAVGDRLDGNFRSSPAICTAVGSLRQGNESDVAVGDASGVTGSVAVAVFRRPTDVRSRVIEILEARGIPEDEVIVLAHAAATSRGCAGAGGSMRSTDSRFVSLAIAVHRFQSVASSPSTRREALRQVQRLMCELGGGEESEADYLESRGLTERSLAERCLRIATELQPPFGGPPSRFKTELSELLRAHQVLTCNLSMLRTPSGDEWPVRPSQNESALRHATIHGFKGLQQRAVALILPKAQAGSQDDGIDQWLSDQPGESRRVLYVGASRAQELLILATHESRKNEVVAKLTKDGVPHVVHA
ncbi:UvrD-helicase domain-containing protein [Nocardioides sp.]|uniref:UvrD-helicase domain-containing protein n=1 Tax=Nocardioides sp. TaxID=35761 RepID=UPI002636423C|nr:UvrD-helicase domain-containing protein [Nocardioides sp.]